MLWVSNTMFCHLDITIAASYRALAAPFGQECAIGVCLPMCKDWGVTTQSEASQEWDKGNKLIRDFRGETLKYSPKSLTFRISVYIYTVHSSVSKDSACNTGDPGSIPGSGRSPGEGNGNPLQYSCLENPMDWGAWQATVPWGRRTRKLLYNTAQSSALWQHGARGVVWEGSSRDGGVYVYLWLVDVWQTNTIL